MEVFSNFIIRIFLTQLSKHPMSSNSHLCRWLLVSAFRNAVLHFAYAMVSIDEMVVGNNSHSNNNNNNDKNKYKALDWVNWFVGHIKAFTMY